MAFLSTLIFVLMWKLGCCMEFIDELLIYEGRIATQTSAHPVEHPDFGSMIVENYREIVQHSRDYFDRYPREIVPYPPIIWDPDQDYDYEYPFVDYDARLSFLDGEVQQMDSLICEDGAVNTSDCSHAYLCTPGSTVAECCREVVERDPEYCSAHWLSMRKCCKESCGLCEKSVGPTACHEMSEAACQRTGGCVYRRDTEQCVDLAFCQDGVKNGNEEGVDCGGSCPNRCNECSFIEIDGSRPRSTSYRPCSARVNSFTSGYCHCAEHDIRMVLDRSHGFRSSCRNICSCEVKPNCVLSQPPRFRNRSCKCARCSGKRAPFRLECVGCISIEHCMEYGVADTKSIPMEDTNRCNCLRCESGLIVSADREVDFVWNSGVRLIYEGSRTCLPVCESGSVDELAARRCAPIICRRPRIREAPSGCSACAEYLGKMCISRRNQVGKCAANRCLPSPQKQRH